MSEEPVIGGEQAPENDPETAAEIATAEAPAETPDGDASEAELAELLRETLLAAHDDLSAEDLAGGSAEEVRARYLAARARLEGEAREARGSQVPAGAPGRFAPAPGTAFEKIREGLGRLGA